MFEETAAKTSTVTHDFDPVAHPGGRKGVAMRSWAVNASGQIAKFVITLVSTAVIARILSAEDYGLVAMVTGFLNFISIFQDLGLSQAAVQRDRITHHQINGLFWFNVVMGLVVMAMVAASAPLVSLFYHRPELTWICLAYAAMAPVSSLGAQHSALLRRKMLYRSLVVRDVTAAVVGAVAGIVAAYGGCDYWSLVIMQAVTSVAGTATLWWQSDWRPSRPTWSGDLKPLIKFGGTVTLSNVLGFVLSGLDSVIIGYFFGPVPLGIYNRAQSTLSRPMRQILPPIMNVASSSFARVAKNPEKFEAAALQLAFPIACASSFVVVIALVGADWIVRIMLGTGWEQAIAITRMLALFAFVEPIASFFGTLLVARGVPDVVVRWRVFSASIIVIGLLAGLPWGLFGVATAYSLSGFFIRTPLFLWFSARHLAIPLQRIFSAVGSPLLAGGLTAAFLTLLRLQVGAPGHAAVALGLYALLAVLVYSALLLSFGTSRTRLRGTLQLVGHGLRKTG